MNAQDKTKDELIKELKELQQENNFLKASYNKDISRRILAKEALKKSNRVYLVSSNINQAIVRIKDKHILFEEVCRIAVEDGKLKMAWIGLVDEKLNKVVPVSSAGFSKDYLDTINIDLNDEKLGNGPTGCVAKSGVHFIANEITTHPAMEPWKENALKLGYQSSASFPIKVFGKTVGVFNLYAEEPHFFDEIEVKLLDGLVLNISFAIEFIENVNKRRQTEEEISMLAHALKSIMECVSITDTEDRLLYVNKTFCNTYGYSEDELLGEHIGMIRSPRNSPEVTRKILPATIRGGWQGELVNRRKDGSEFSIYLSTSPIKNDKGHLIALMGVATDITERKRVEKALQASEERFRSLYKNTTIGLYRTTPDGRILLANPALVKMLRFESFEELAARNLEIEGFKQTYERKDFIKRIEKEEVIIGLESEWTSKDGDVIYVRESTKAIRDANGKTLYFDGTVENITERKRSEQIQQVILNIANKSQLAVSFEETMLIIQEELKCLMDTKNFYVALYEEETDHVTLPYFQDEKDDIDKFPAEKTLTGLVIKHGHSLLIDNAKAKILENEGKIEKIGFDSEIWLGVPLKLKGKVIGAFVVQSYTNPNAYTEKDKEVLEIISHQISISIEKKLIEGKLIEALEAAKESDRLKSAFLANMSHEIRTPMNGILGFAALLKEPNLTGEQQQEYIRVIEKSGVRMLNIINDIIDISKIEAGLMKVVMNETDINEQLEFIYTFFKPEVDGKGMQLFFKNRLLGKEAIIKTDSEKIFAILINLVKNAIKYSEKGSIEFGYVKTGSTTTSEITGEFIEPVELKFFVKDTGIGIHKNRQEAIFERFIQADINDKMARHGAGLGLSISKAYVEMLGGKMWVESKEEVGSTFYFTIPYKVNPKEETVMNDVFSEIGTINLVKKLKILIVEDDQLTVMLLKIIVKEFVKEIIEVGTGMEAVEVCRNNPDIDLVMMDIQMPEMDGLEATRQIRQFNKDAIIIVQTAFALNGDRENAISAGCNDYISKPMKNDLLREIIQKYFGKSE